MTSALWNIKSSSRSFCAEFAHSWPHLLLGYPVERHGRLGAPKQRGFPCRGTLSRQWEMLLLSLVSSVTEKESHEGQRFVVVSGMFDCRCMSLMERLIVAAHPLIYHTNISLYSSSFLTGSGWVRGLFLMAVSSDLHVLLNHLHSFLIMRRQKSQFLMYLFKIKSS